MIPIELDDMGLAIWKHKYSRCLFVERHYYWCDRIIVLDEVERHYYWCDRIIALDETDGCRKVIGGY